MRSFSRLLPLLFVASCYASEPVPVPGGLTRDAGSNLADASSSCPFDASLVLPTVGYVGVKPPNGASLALHVQSSTSLELTEIGSGATYAFAWRGPALPFVEGELVTAIVGALATDWHGFSGPSGTALAHSLESFTLISAIPNLPTSPVVFTTRTPLCTTPDDAVETCGLPASVITFYRVGLAQGSVESDAVPGETTDPVGGWRLTNVRSLSTPSYGSTNCVVEAAGIEALTALGP